MAPVYFLSGDEPFQLDEAAAQIRQAAKAQGYTEREVYHVDRSFDWDLLTQSAGSMSLFAERKLIELRIPGGKPGDKGSKALVDYTQQLPEDNLLLIVSAKLDAAQTKSKWFKALDAVGATLAVWPLELQQLPAWLKKRMQLRGLQPSEDALTILAEQVEGNLLAADQELEKMLLLYGEGSITAEQVIEASMSLLVISSPSMASLKASKQSSLILTPHLRAKTLCPTPTIATSSIRTSPRLVSKRV